MSGDQRAGQPQEGLGFRQPHDLNGATVEERACGGGRLTCYAGHYEVKDGSVFHHIEMALNPNLIGQTLIRRVHIDGPILRCRRCPTRTAIIAASNGGGCRGSRPRRRVRTRCSA